MPGILTPVQPAPHLRHQSPQIIHIDFAMLAIGKHPAAVEEGKAITVNGRISL